MTMLRLSSVVRVASSWASPVLARADDGNEWWVKDPRTSVRREKDNEEKKNEYRRSLANEFITAGLGKLIGAPVWDSCLIEIPEGVSIPGRSGSRRTVDTLAPGIGWASKHLPLRITGSDLRYRDEADNIRRFVSLMALFDWCSGEAPGYIYGPDRLEVYHRSGGAFLNTDREGLLPPFGYADWGRANRVQLRGMVRFDGDEIDRVAGRLRGLCDEDIATVFLQAPRSWIGIERSDLYIRLLDSREHVAQRLEEFK